MVLLPVAVYGLEVPAGDIMVPAIADFPATFRITMAAVDPTEVVDSELASRSTLKIIRQPISPDEDEDDDEDSDDEEYMRALLDADDDEESDEEAGPSDPSKSKKALKQAAIEELMAAVKGDESSDDEMADADVKISKKGKAKATEEDDSEEDSEDESDDGEDLEMEEFVICTLDTEKNYQQTLDITVGEDEHVYFKVTGSHTIYLTGNYLIPDDNGHNHHHEVYDSDEDEDYDLSPDEDELDEEESDDLLDDLEDPRIAEVESDEEEAPALVKADKKGKNKRAAEDEAENLDDMMAAAEKPEEKLSKKQLKKQKKNNGEAIPTKDESKDKKVQFAKNLEQGPTGSTAAEAKPASSAAPAAAKGALGTRTIKGVKIDDKKLGSGPAAKNGDRVGMRYIGKLTDGKQFDANKKGKPFSFKLGKGEVIQGWDIGVAGMTVGGERRITIPANLAYGSKALPGIPSNSTLIFDIKLLEIK